MCKRVQPYPFRDRHITGSEQACHSRITGVHHQHGRRREVGRTAQGQSLLHVRSSFFCLSHSPSSKEDGSSCSIYLKSAKEP